MKIVLSYRRVGTACTGRVVVRDGASEHEVSTFDELPFPRALELFAHALAHAPGAEAVFERTDRRGLAACILDPTSSERLRAGDPAIVRALSEPLENPR